MQTQELHTGAVIPIITVFITRDPDTNIDTAVNLNGATAMALVYLKSDGTTRGQFPLSFVTDGTDGQAQYITGPLDLDQSGPWQFQGVATVNGVTYMTDIINEYIHPNL